MQTEPFLLWTRRPRGFEGLAQGHVVDGGGLSQSMSNVQLQDVTSQESSGWHWDLPHCPVVFGAPRAVESVRPDISSEAQKRGPSWAAGADGALVGMHTGAGAGPMEPPEMRSGKGVDKGQGAAWAERGDRATTNGCCLLARSAPDPLSMVMESPQTPHGRGAVHPHL